MIGPSDSAGTPSKAKAARPTRRQVLGVAGLTLGGIATTGYARQVAPHRVAITRYAISPRRWPVGGNLRVAALADLHAHPRCMGVTALAEVVSRTNAEGPDLVVLLGDYGSQHPEVCHWKP